MSALIDRAGGAGGEKTPDLSGAVFEKIVVNNTKAVNYNNWWIGLFYVGQYTESRNISTPAKTTNTIELRAPALLWYTRNTFADQPAKTECEYMVENNVLTITVT